MAKRKIKENDLPQEYKDIERSIKAIRNREGVLDLLESWGYTGKVIKIGQYRSNIFDLITMKNQHLSISTEAHWKGYHVTGDGFEIKMVLGVMLNSKKYYLNIYLDVKYIETIGDICNLSVSCENYGWYTDDVPLWNILWVNYQQIMDDLKINNPHQYDYCLENDRYSSLILSFPALEILDKAGFSIVEKKFFSTDLNPNEKVTLARNFKAGSSPKTIIQMPKRYYKEMKDVININVWDNIRKLIKTTDIGIDSIKMILHDHVFMHNIACVYSILKSKWNNKPVFDAEKLIAYLGRIDMYEAIDSQEGIVLLNDYLQMCQELHMKPKIDGDSLKREHDVAARLCRQKRDAIIAESMQSKCDELQKYNYSEEVFMVRGIRDYDDLIDEAKQQHNCVASYARRIMDGRSGIYVMREVKYPDRSLITIELSPDGRNIRQKLLAYNQRIRNKAQSEFIERWHRYVLQHA